MSSPSEPTITVEVMDGEDEQCPICGDPFIIVTMSSWAQYTLRCLCMNCDQKDT